MGGQHLEGASPALSTVAGAAEDDRFGSIKQTVQACRSLKGTADHNTTTAYPGAHHKAHELGIALVPAVELDRHILQF